MSFRKKIAHRRSILTFVGFFLLSFFSLREIILEPGTVGHHWDWSIPPSSQYFAQMLNQSTHVWSSQFLGFPFNYGVSVLPTLAVLGSLGTLGFSGEIVSKGLLLIVITVSGYGMHELVLELVRDRLIPGSSPTSQFASYPASLVSGYFYAFSPFLFNEIVGGAYTQFLSYAIAPLVIGAFLRCCTGRTSWKSSATAALSLSALSMSLQYLFLVLVLFLAIAFATRMKGFAAFARVLSIWAPLNMYWILPLIFSFDSLQAQIASQSSTQSVLQNLTVHTPNLLQAIVGTGYWTDFFSATIPAWFYSEWFMISIVLVSSSLVYLLARPVRSWLALWAPILIVSIIFETGSNSPFRGLVDWIFVNFPLMILFKSPQHLIFPTTLALAVILGLFSANVLRRYASRRKLIVFFVLVLAVSVWVSPFFSGNLGGNVDVYGLPTGYSNINSIISHDNESAFRVLYLPMSGSPLYVNDNFQRENQGGDPTISYSQMPTIVDDLTSNPQAKEFATSMEVMLAGFDPPPNAAKLLSLVSVKYIVLRDDVLPNFGPLVGGWNVTRVYQNLIHLDGVKLIANYPEASLWENDVPSVPLIYGAIKAIYDDPPIYAIRNWQPLSGQWTAFEQYSVFGNGGILRTNQVFVDTDLIVKTQLVPSAKSLDNWILWRGADMNNYYYAGQTGIGYFTVGKVVQGQRTELFSQWVSYLANQTLWIRIISQGSTFKVLSSGDGQNWIPMYTFNDGTFPAGFAALRSGGMGRFSNVTANDLNNNLVFRDDFSRSNLIQLVLSNDFVLGKSVVVSPTDVIQGTLDPNAIVSQTSGSETQHLIQIASSGPFYLVEGETFDAGWTLFAPGAIHIVANGWMNSWLVSSGLSLKTSLFYGPQRLYEYGITLSILALATLVALLISNSFILDRAKRRNSATATDSVKSKRSANSNES